MRELRRRNKQFEQENEILRRATAYFARGTLVLAEQHHECAEGRRYLGLLARSRMTVAVGGTPNIPAPNREEVAITA